MVGIAYIKATYPSPVRIGDKQAYSGWISPDQLAEDYIGRDRAKAALEAMRISTTDSLTNLYSDSMKALKVSRPDTNVDSLQDIIAGLKKDHTADAQRIKDLTCANNVQLE